MLLVLTAVVLIIAAGEGLSLVERWHPSWLVSMWHMRDRTPFVILSVIALFLAIVYEGVQGNRRDK
jgi:hypothetical protein